MSVLLPEVGFTQGGLYFHFPEGTDAVAKEIIRRQDSRFAELRDAAIANAHLDGHVWCGTKSSAAARRHLEEFVANDERQGVSHIAQTSVGFPLTTVTALGYTLPDTTQEA